MKRIAVIPARMASSRFPGKPLAKIAGMPMIGHIYLRAKQATKIDDLFVATCDKEIFDYVTSIGGKAIMTKDTHERATERVGEAVDTIVSKGLGNPQIVVMVQGDEPLIRPEAIDSLVTKLELSPDIAVVNLANEISADGEYQDKNIVKLIYDDTGRVIWFFRQPSPFWQTKVRDLPIKIQTGIIAFTADALKIFNNFSSTPFEKANSVDMCRYLEHNFPLYMVSSNRRLFSVDTPEDLLNVEKKMVNDDMFLRYGNV